MKRVCSAYAVYSKNERIRLESSSGAFFSLIGDMIIEQRGVVYGVAMSLDCRSAEYIRVGTKDEIKRLRGSKYMQAKIGNTFKQVKEDLQNGVPVLFTGTGCQINGLKGYLGKEYDNLYCIDVICHGVPSPALWCKYVEHFEQVNDAKLVHVNFRCKDDSWSDFGIKMIDSKHKEVYMSKDKNSYMQMFLRDYCLRPSCYECKAKEQKLSDITIADFWGIENIAPEMNDKKGISLVIIRTGIGKQLFDQIRNDMIIKEVNYEDSVKGNSAEYSSVTKPKKRSIFFNDMYELEFEELEKKYASPISISYKKKIKNRIKNILIKTPVRVIIKRNK